MVERRRWVRMVQTRAEANLKKPSMESYDNVERSGILVEPDFSRAYYNRFWAPDEPSKVKSGEYDWDTYLQEFVVGKAEGSPKMQMRILEALTDVSPCYRAKKVKGVGPALVADGVYALAPEEGSLAELGTYPVEVTFEGEYCGENLFKDGAIVKPKKVLKVVERGKVVR